MTAPEWTRLENSAIIYPSCRTKKYATVFKMSASLGSEVDPSVLDRALKNVIGRFPGFRYTLRKGLFWWFLQKLENEPEVSDDLDLKPINTGLNGGYMFKLGCRGCDIELNVYHALTDGTGAMTFLMSVVAEYLRITGVNFEGYGKWVFDPFSEPCEEELEDGFDRFSGTKGALDDEKSAWHIPGTNISHDLLNNVRVSVRSQDLLSRTRELGCTVTEYLVTLMLLSLQDVHREKGGKSNFLRMEVPVNLRPIYGCKTLRNFSSYVYIALDVTNGYFSFEDALQEVKYQKRLYTQPSRLTRRIAANVALEDNLAIRCIPLFIKKPIINLINFLKGDNYATYTLSNLGNIDLPEGMAQAVKDANFTLGRTLRRSGTCACVSNGGVTNLNFSRKIVEDEFERAFVQRLRDENIHASVQVMLAAKKKPAVKERKSRPILCQRHFLPSFLLSI